MALHNQARSQLDARALEARTQAIGEELFTEAKRGHASLSVLNRWTAQMLSWCLSDPQVKANVLRFIDALPALQSPREVARHLRDYFPSTVKLPAALRLGAELARPGMLTQGALAAVIRALVEQVARQFIAEHRPDGAAHVIRELASHGATCSLDILGEQVLSEAEADHYVAQCASLLQESIEATAHLPTSTIVATTIPRVNLSVKPSALTPRFDPISPEPSIEAAGARLRPLLELAARHGGIVNLDMEQYELRDLTLALAKHLLLQPHADGRLSVGVVLQAYLRDAEATLEELLAWLAAHDRTLTIRLVKGAYWDAEVAHAAQRHWPIPVYQDKAETDLAFERLTKRLLSAYPLVTTAIASHNVRSIAHAMAAAEALGVAKHQLEFQLLYGMGEAIHAAIVSMGYPVRIYTPIGQLIPGMAYLVRRILENTANESFLRQDLFRERSAHELLKAPAVAQEAEVANGTPTADGGSGSSQAVVASSTRDAAPRWQATPLLDFSKANARDCMAHALAAVRESLGREYPLLIGGEAVRTRQTANVRNPAKPSEVIGVISQASRVDVDRAVAVAAQAQPRWAQLPVSERVARLRQAAALMRERRVELAAWMILEVGKTWREADADVVEAIDFIEYYAHGMTELAHGRPLPQFPGERNLYLYHPRGVAAVIAPWNFPAAILTGMASAALVTGNAVILKPAGPSPVIAAHLAQMFRAAGIPPDVIQFLPGAGEEAGAALVGHPGIATVLFTGSKAVGTSIIEACGRVPSGQRGIKRVIAEMGGKNAIILDADADLDAAVGGTLRSAFGYGGQKCSAASRLIVHQAVYDRFLPRLAAAVDRLVVGDPSDPATDVGPLIDETAQRRLRQAVERAGRVGTVAYEYPASRLPSSGWFVGPVVAADVPRGDALATEELFGPFVCCFRVDTFDEALALANATDYALTGGVYSRSPAHLEQAIRAFDVGNLYLNRPITGALVGRQPFGGHRRSGLGTKAGGPDYLLQLLIPKTISADTTRYGMPLD